MADFCLRCSLELYGGGYNELAGLADEGQVVLALCGGCGIIWVDHEGKCRKDCPKNHYETELKLDSMQNCTNENSTSEIPREHVENPTSES